MRVTGRGVIVCVGSLLGLALIGGWVKWLHWTLTSPVADMADNLGGLSLAGLVILLGLVVVGIIVWEANPS